jgi:multisubunit Na+/H+ antiporter MnhE subunit
MTPRKPAYKWKQIATFGLVEWLVFFWLWVLFENQTNFYELLFGAGAAVLAAVGTEIIRIHHLASFRPRLIWIVQGWRLPWYIVQGCWVISWTLLKQPFHSEKSVLRSVPFDPGGSDAHSAARRALAITYTTLPPNFVVLSIDLEKKVMVVHQVQKSPTPIMTKNLGAKA